MPCLTLSGTWPPTLDLPQGWMVCVHQFLQSMNTRRDTSFSACKNIDEKASYLMHLPDVFFFLHPSRTSGALFGEWGIMRRMDRKWAPVELFATWLPEHFIKTQISIHRSSVHRCGPSNKKRPTNRPRTMVLQAGLTVKGWGWFGLVHRPDIIKLMLYIFTMTTL